MTPEEFYYEYKVMGRKGDLTEEDVCDMLTKYSQQKQDYIETLEREVGKLSARSRVLMNLFGFDYRDLTDEDIKKLIDKANQLSVWCGVTTKEAATAIGKVLSEFNDTRCHKE